MYSATHYRSSNSLHQKLSALLHKVWIYSVVLISVTMTTVSQSVAHGLGDMPLVSNIVSKDVPYGGDEYDDIAQNVVFDTELEAVIAATDLYNPLSIKEDREYMGAILKCQDKYYYSAAPGEKGKDLIHVELSVPSRCDLKAFWHTHGAEHYSRQYFSKVDTVLANKWQKPFYLADYTGILKVYEPGDKTLRRSEAKRLRLGNNAGFAKGQAVKSPEGTIVKVAVKSGVLNQEIARLQSH